MLEIHQKQPRFRVFRVFRGYRRLVICDSAIPFELTAQSSQHYTNRMATLTLELPPQPAQSAFNLQRWAEVLADRQFAKFEGRIETDRYGHVIMSPPPAPTHGSFQARIASLLDRL